MYRTSDKISAVYFSLQVFRQEAEMILMASWKHKKWRYSLHTFWTLALVGSERSFSCFVCCTLWGNSPQFSLDMNIWISLPVCGTELQAYTLLIELSWIFFSTVSLTGRSVPPSEVSEPHQESQRVLLMPRGCLPFIFLMPDKRSLTVFPFTSAHLMHLCTYYVLYECVIYVSFYLNF
jgi:hypothetical protein